MKRLKPTLLALGIAAAPLAAQAGMKPLDDQIMGDITGQAGVTIELEAQVTIGEFIYTDEGSLGIKDIFIGGANRDDMFPEIGFAIPNQATDLLDNMKIDIDINADGDLVIQVLPLGFASPVDFAVRTGEWELRGHSDSTVLLDNLSIEGVFGALKLQVDTSTDTLNIETRFAIDDMSMDIPFLAMGIRDMRITGADYDPSNPNLVRLFALADLDIYKAPNAAGVDSLAVDINTFSADITIGSVLVGGTSIGSIFVDDLVISNTSMRIYGH